MESTDRGRTISVLLVEDNEHDAIALKRALQKSDHNFVLTTVAKAETALTDLKCNSIDFDVIVTDYNLPGMNGFDLFKKISSIGLEIPFVMVTGAGSEDVAVESLKAGVDDYLIKDSNASFLDLLPVVLVHVIRKHDDRISRKRAEDALRNSEKRYREVVENAAEVILATTNSGKITYVNPAGVRISGYTRQQLLTMNYTDLILPEYRNRIRFHCSRIYLSPDRDGLTEYPILTCSGREIWIAQNATAIVESGKVTGFHIIARDVTERKRAELERENLIKELQDALGKIKTLKGLIPICASCKKIRDDRGYWNQVEQYISEHSEAVFSHGICPECARKYFPN